MKRMIRLLSLLIALALPSALGGAALAEYDPAATLCGYWTYDASSPLADASLSELMGDLPNLCFRPGGVATVFYEGQAKDTAYTVDLDGAITLDIGGEPWSFRQTGDTMYLSVSFFGMSLFFPYARMAALPEEQIAQADFAGVYLLTAADGQSEETWLFTPGGAMVPVYVSFLNLDAAAGRYELRDGFILADGAYWAVLTDGGAALLDGSATLSQVSPYALLEQTEGGFLPATAETVTGLYGVASGEGYDISLLLGPGGLLLQITADENGETTYLPGDWAADGELVTLNGSSYALLTADGLSMVDGAARYPKTATYADYMDAHGGMLSEAAMFQALEGAYQLPDGTVCLLTADGHAVTVESSGYSYDFRVDDVSVSGNLAVFGFNVVWCVDGKVVPLLGCESWQRLSSATEYLEAIGAVGEPAFDPAELTGEWTRLALPGGYYVSLNETLIFDGESHLLDATGEPGDSYAVHGDTVWLYREYEGWSDRYDARRLTLSGTTLTASVVFSDETLQLSYIKAQADQQFDYRVTVDGEAIITGWHAPEDQDVVYLGIPPTINGYPVTRLEANAFRECATLRAVFLPEGVRSIGTNCFRECPRLTWVELPSTIEDLGDYIFTGSDALKEIHVPEGVRTLNATALFGRNVYLPRSLEEITGNVGYTVYVYNGSYAHQWARENNFSFEIIEEDAE